MRRKFEPTLEDNLSNLTQDLLHLTFRLLYTNELLKLKLLNKRLYQQVMHYYLTEGQTLTFLLLKHLGKGLATALPIPKESIRDAILNPNLHIDYRMFGLDYLAASNKLKLEVANEIVQGLISKIREFSMLESWKELMYDDLSIDLSLIAKHLTQGQLNTLKQTLISIPTIVLENKKYYWQSEAMSILRPFINTNMGFISPPISKKLAWVRQKLKLRALTNTTSYFDKLSEILPYLTKEEIKNDIRALLERVSQAATSEEPTKDNILCFCTLSALAKYLDNDTLSELLTIYVEMATRSPHLLLHVTQTAQWFATLVKAIASYLDEAHLPHIEALYNLLPSDSMIQHNMDRSLFVDVARAIKEPLVIPYLKIFIKREGFLPYLTLLVLNRVHALIPNQHRSEFATFVYNQLNHKDLNTKTLVYHLLGHFISNLSQEQLTQVFDIFLNNRHIEVPVFPKYKFEIIRAPLLECLKKRLLSLPTDENQYHSLIDLGRIAPMLVNSGIKIDLQPLFDLLEKEPYAVLTSLCWFAPYMISENISLNLKKMMDVFYHEFQLMENYQDNYRNMARDVLVELAKHSTASQQTDFQTLLEKAFSSPNKEIMAAAIEIYAHLKLDATQCNEVLVNWIPKLIQEEDIEFKRIAFDSLKALLPCLPPEQLPLALQGIELSLSFQDSYINDTITYILNYLIEFNKLEDYQQRLKVIDLILLIPLKPTIYKELSLLTKITIECNVQQVGEIFNKLIPYYEKVQSLKDKLHIKLWVKHSMMNILSYWLLTGKITPEKLKQSPFMVGNEILAQFVNSFVQIAESPYNNNRLFKYKPCDNEMDVENCVKGMSI